MSSRYIEWHDRRAEAEAEARLADLKERGFGVSLEWDAPHRRWRIVYWTIPANYASR